MDDLDPPSYPSYPFISPMTGNLWKPPYISNHHPPRPFPQGLPNKPPFLPQLLRQLPQCLATALQAVLEEAKEAMALAKGGQPRMETKLGELRNK
jgi:hypothetical protein